MLDQSVFTENSFSPKQDFELIFSDDYLEYIVIKTQQLIIHHIKLNTMNDQQISKFYKKYNIFMPSQVAKASLKRKCEFFIGRLAAKFALTNLGDYSSFIIEKGLKGEPLWPELVTGSISHSMLNCTQGIAIATAFPINQHPPDKAEIKIQNCVNNNDYAATKFSGIDIETKQNADIFNQNPSILNSLLSPQETKFIHSFLDKIPALYLILFSAKESITKVLYSKFQKLIAFNAMHCIALCPITRTLSFYLPQIATQQKIQVNFLDLDEEIITFCCLDS
jgi:enterobactin synthetase component D